MPMNFWRMNFWRMKFSRMKFWRTLAAPGMLLIATGLHPALAEFVVNFNQVGANVVATGTGSVDTADLTLGDTALTAAGEGMIPAWRCCSSHQARRRTQRNG